MPRKIEISHRTIVFTILVLIFLWFLYQIKEIIFLFFISLLIMSILNPIVTKLSKFKIPRAFSVILTYLMLIVIIGVSIVGIMPALVDQTAKFASNLPLYLENVGLPLFISDQLTKILISQVGVIPGQILKVGVTIFSNILGVFTIFVFAFYLLLAREKLDEQLVLFFGEDKRKKIGRFIDLMEGKLGGWVRGELTLMTFVAILTLIGLTLLGIPFSLPLAILAGILEIVPNIGPVVAAIPAVLIGFGISPITGFATVALCFLIQQIENYILVPKIMEKSTGISPLFTLLALTIGFKLAGVVGMLISVPVFITGQVFFREYLASKK